MAAPWPAHRFALLIAATLLASLCVRLYFALMPDTMGDMRIFSVWAYQIERFGIAGAYATASPYPIDYPPGFLYVLGFIAWLRGEIDTSPWGPAADMQFWIPISYVIADLLTAVLVYLALARVATRRTAYLGLLFYAFNPAILFASAYWGVMDSTNVLLTLFALVMLDYRKPELSWAAITVAVFTKQFAAPVSLVIAVLTLKEYGWRRALGCAAVSLCLSLLMLAPLLLEYPPLLVVERTLFDFGNMAYVTANAHNFWWIVTGGPPWIYTSTPLLGSVTYQPVGTVLFASLWAAALATLYWKRSDFVTRYTLTALITCGFFMLVTHMHENHLHTTLAVLAVVALRDRRMAAIYGLLSATMLTNMVLHDPYLVTEYLYGIPFDMRSLMQFTFAPAGQEMSALHRGLTLANATLNFLVFLAFLYVAVTHVRRAQPAAANADDSRG